MSGGDPLKLANLAARAGRAFTATTPLDALRSFRAIVGDQNAERLGEDATEALRRLQDPALGRPTPAQLAALEQAIRMLRPSLRSQRGALEPMPEGCLAVFPQWQGFAHAVTPFLYSVGRIDRLETTAGNQVRATGVGTGFLVSERLLCTNLHVLMQLSAGLGDLSPGQAQVSFQLEFQVSPTEPPFPILGVVARHETLDLALLEVARVPLTETRRALQLDATAVEEGRAVVAIGYPFNDSARNPLFIDVLFGEGFGVKRAAPGEVLGGGAERLFHDCTTLGGNSGSAILAMDTAKVVAVHSDGAFMYRNQGVAAAAAAELIAPHL